MKWHDIRIWKWVYIILVIGVALFAFAGCKTKYVSVPEYHTKYICRAETIASVDSVQIRDSVYIYHSGDTVVINKTAYRDRYHNIYRVKNDTIYRRDSVSVPYPVERQLTKSEQRLMTLGMLFIVFILLLVVGMVFAVWWYHNKK